MRKANEDMTKLPKWARDKISTLSSDVMYYQEQLNNLMGQVPSNISIDRALISPQSPTIYIPEYSRMDFKTRFGQISVQLDMRNVLKISSSRGGIVVLPYASNTITVGVVDYSGRLIIIPEGKENAEG